MSYLCTTYHKGIYQKSDMLVLRHNQQVENPCCFASSLTVRAPIKGETGSTPVLNNHSYHIKNRAIYIALFPFLLT